jgi:hypothetical protein
MRIAGKDTTRRESIARVACVEWERGQESRLHVRADARTRSEPPVQNSLFFSGLGGRPAPGVDMPATWVFFFFIFLVA